MIEKLSSPGLDGTLSGGASSVRLEDVAAAAGVSTVTVSRCISNPGRVSEKTRQHVLRVAERLGYIPNRLASSLASSKSKVIGAVIPTMLNPIHGVVLQAAFEILAPAGYQLFLGNSHYSESEELNLVRSFLGHKVDGVFLTGRDHAEECIALLRRPGIPTVEMFEYITDPIDVAIGTSNFEAGFSLGRYLIARGRRRLAFVGHTNFGDSRILGRHEGLVAACHEQDLPPALAYSVLSQPGSGNGGEIVGSILREHPDVDAVVFAGHQIAVGAIRYALDVGIDVPRRLGIAAFGDSPIAQWMRPALTTVRFPLEEMGRQAGKALLERFRGVAPVARTVRLGFEIISRESA